ncbi:SDR family oxidoreductase [Dactylosporangium sp. CS-033363]|uniref:SDR family oxidoreductase n=1 Tax=Dactylosporangium sp. CS-033363 TaxID=3239935 RepID=UPI003D89E0D5
MDLELQDRVAIVCGSTGGLGLAAARRLAAEGAHVVVSGRRKDHLDAIVAELPSAIGIPIDYAEEHAAEVLYSSTVEAFGRADIVVLNGPGPAPVQARDIAGPGLQAALRTLVEFPIALANLAAPGMVARGWGRIVLIGSSGVVTPIPRLATSNVARAAAAAYIKTLAGELSGAGVTANVVVPGRVATDRVAALDEAQAGREQVDVEQVRAASRARIPAGRYGLPEEMADLIAFVCSGRASYVSGSVLRCDGGMIPTL